MTEWFKSDERRGEMFFSGTGTGYARLSKKLRAELGNPTHVRFGKDPGELVIGPCAAGDVGKKSVTRQGVVWLPTAITVPSERVYVRPTAEGCVSCPWQWEDEGTEV